MSSPRDEFNPYAAPLADPTLDGAGFFPNPKTPGEVGAWRDGKLLVMCEGAAVPDRCVRCNGPANGYLLKRKLYWHHPAWYLLILLHILLYASVAFVIRKKAKVMIPLCERHRRRRVRAIIIGWMFGLGGPALIVAAAVSTSSVFADRIRADQVTVAGVFLGIAMTFGGIIYGLIVARVVVTKRIVNTYAWISKVDPRFLATLPSLHERSSVELWPVNRK